jgi:hypothetical protein
LLLLLLLEELLSAVDDGCAPAAAIDVRAKLESEEKLSPRLAPTRSILVPTEWMFERNKKTDAWCDTSLTAPRIAIIFLPTSSLACVGFDSFIRFASRSALVVS